MPGRGDFKEDNQIYSVEDSNEVSCWSRNSQSVCVLYTRAFWIAICVLKSIKQSILVFF